MHTASLRSMLSLLLFYTIFICDAFIFVLKPSFSYFKTLHLPVTEAILVDILSEKSSETKNPLNTKKHEALHCGKMLLVTLTTVLQIRDFQLVGLKGILKPQLVQKSCIFLLPSNTKNGILYRVYIRYSHEKYTLIMLFYVIIFRSF